MVTQANYPNDENAEAGVLGSVLLHSSALDVISLKPSDFYDGRNQVIYQTLLEMWSDGHQAIDPVTLSEELERKHRLQSAGGALHVQEMCEAVPHVEHVRYYAGIVEAKSQLRKIMQACERASSQAQTHTEPESVLGALEASCLQIREGCAVSEIKSLSEAVTALEERERNPKAIHQTGLADLDGQLGGGLRDGQLMIVGGRPGDGKSVLTTQIAAHLTTRDEPALIISLEMKEAEIAYRLSKATDRDTLRGLPLFIADQCRDVGRLAALIRLAHRRDGIQLAVVDYLQLVPPSDKRIPREQQVAEVSRTLKQLAMDLSIPVIAACQLNRQSDKDKRAPRLSDLRESGAIEQDADIVCLINREEDAAALVVAKNRNGSPGIVPAGSCRT